MIDVLNANEATLSQLSGELCGLAFDASPHPMWVFAKGTLEFLAVNDAALRAYGFDRDQFMRMSILDIRPPEEVVLVTRDALRPHESFGAVEHWKHQKKNGEIMNVELTCHELVFNGRPSRLITVLRQEPVGKK